MMIGPILTDNGPESTQFEAKFGQHWFGMGQIEVQSMPKSAQMRPIPDQVWPKLG